MIDRYCFVKLKDQHVANRADLARALRAMLADLDGALGVSVGLPADDSAARWDLSLVIRAPDLARWDALADDEAVREVFVSWLPEHAVVIKAWTFDVGQAVG
jgi:hypothetical protein